MGIPLDYLVSFNKLAETIIQNYFINIPITVIPYFISLYKMLK